MRYTVGVAPMAAAMFAAAAADPAAAQPDFTADHELTFTPGDWLLWPESGKLWVTDRAEGRVVELDPAAGTELRSIEAEGPAAMVAAGKILLAAGPKSNSLYVIDPKEG